MTNQGEWMKNIHEKYLNEDNQSLSAKKSLVDLGIDVWRVDTSTTITISITYEDDFAYKDSKIQKEMIDRIAKIYKVHPSWVEYDPSVPDLKITFEKVLLKSI